MDYMLGETIDGVFIMEHKNRFLCDVQFADASIHECYIPSSCHLSNFIAMNGRRVFLQRNLSKRARTEFRICAVETQHGIVPVELVLSNRIIESELHQRRFNYLGARKVREKVIREHTIDGYKCDLYIPETKNILEIKSIISLNKYAYFPAINSERSCKQLIQISELLSKGFKVDYIFVSMCKTVKRIIINRDVSEYYTQFVNCIKSGMRCHAYNLYINDGEPKIFRSIQIILE